MKPTRRYYLVIAILTGVLISQSVVFAEPMKQFVLHLASYPIMIQGNEYKEEGDLPILNYNGSTYVPLKAIGELLGTQVNWNDKQKRVEMQSALPSQQPEPIGSAPVLNQAILNKSQTEILERLDAIEQWTIKTLYTGQPAITETQKNEIVGKLEELYSKEEAQELFSYLYKQNGNVYEDLPGDHFPIGDLNKDLNIIRDFHTINGQQVNMLTVTGKYEWEVSGETIVNGSYKKQYVLDKELHKIIDQSPLFLPL